MDTNKQFAASLKLKYPILSDPQGKLAQQMGILGPNGMARRVTFVIDKQGVIRSISSQVAPGTHGADLVKVLEEMKIGRK
ncbi:MAG: redoxin domain-containing protein [Armatimonadetes bacterium]|nr:redoxin domain-containing protein [Armatimonadota bacterium]